jgi:hypothetical protein
LSRGSRVSKGSRGSRGSRGRWVLRGWPGGVIHPLSFPLTVFGLLLQDVHQCPPDSILPVMTIYTFATSSLAACLHTAQNRVHKANPKTTSSVTVQKSAHHKRFGFLLPTFGHSSTRNRYWACLRAESHCAVTSADGLRTPSHDDVTFMVGSVGCVVV